ncbi:hypothetical protein QQZ08_010109 [Neonectria magnoliae]|uniref:DUF676 domain-containing protein n=1 Tax=Neonectria magnoliae TaxID=2732573 RepID=A0ABR1HIT3_9HYPO
MGSGLFITRLTYYSIIVVHGLNPRSKADETHAWDTWRTPPGPEGKLWLRDDLPKELPDARIFLYEYNSTAVYGNDRSTFIYKVNAFLEAIRTKRRKSPGRPLLLLGHSLGGLLIKQALINAHNNEKYHDIKAATQGLAIGEIAAKIALSLGFQKGDNILDTLDKGSMFSDLMQEHWKQRLLEYPIVSFWGTLDNVVPRESTSFGLPGKHENVVSLQATHGGICKFGTSQQGRDNLEPVQANIQGLYEKATENADFEDQKSADTALCCLLRQVFIQRPDLLSDHILRTFEQDGDVLLHSFRELWDIQASVARRNTVGQIVCILDALDECEQADDRRLLLETLSNFYLKDRDTGRLKFLVTNRPYVNIEQGFHHLEMKIPTIHVRGEDQSETDKIAKEIDLVIAARVTEAANKLKLTGEEEQVLREEITEKSNRTYLWIYLIFEAVETWVDRSKSRISKQMKNIPATVDEAYERILSRSPDAERARKLLHIIVAAARPLTLKEMAIAMAIKDSHTSTSQLQLEQETRFRIAVRELCGLFVSIIDVKIYLLHQTAAEFLVERYLADSTTPTGLSGDKTPCLKWKQSLFPNSSNRILGSICARFLLFTDVTAYVRGNSLHKSRFESLSSLDRHYPFLVYSLENWAIHLRKVDIDKGFLLSHMLQLCDINHPVCLFLSWKWWRKTKKDMQPEHLPSLVAASYLGLAAVTRHLLELKDTDANAREGVYGFSALYWAALNGHEAVVKTFVDAENHYRQRVGTMKRLLGIRYVTLDKRIKFDHKRTLSRYYSESYNPTALSGAVCGRHKEVVEQLIATRRMTVAKEMLFEAAKDDHVDVLKALLDTGQVRSTCKARNKQSLLNWAITHKSLEVTKYLLATGRFDIELEINSRDDSGRTPLSYAAEQGHEGVVEQMIATGEADVNSRDDSGRMPLSYAVERGWEGAVRQLLKTTNVDINTPDIYGATPFLMAVSQWRSHWSVVEQLMAHPGINVDCRYNVAAEYGSRDLVKKLLEAGGTSTDTKDNKGRTPLAWFAQRSTRDRSILRLLLDIGEVDVNSRDIDGRTPLMHAAARGKCQKVKALLETGQVETDARNSSGHTATLLCTRLPTPEVSQTEDASLKKILRNRDL